MRANSTAVWQDMDRQHHMHPFSDTQDLNARGTRIITKAEGIYIHSSEGEKLIDGMAGLWCVNIGYGRKELAKAAYDQMLELPYYNTFFQSSTPPTTELAARLPQIAPKGLNHVFFNNSGSEANDTIVKLVRLYWNTMGMSKKKTIIARDDSYHGSTLAAASLCGLTHMHPQFDLPLPGFAHIPAPYWYRDGGEMSPADYGMKTAAALEQKILELGADTVGAFIGEPIMGAGGVIMPPPGYWAEIQRICRKYDVLVIADEVICGFGRTGKWFGSDTYGIDPDFMTMAKGLSSGYMPISAVMLHDRVAGPLIEKAGEIAHGMTYSGHPVACAVALRNIEILDQEGIVERCGREIGPYFQVKLRESLADHPLVGEVRGIGLIAAIELAADRKTRRAHPAEKKVGYTCRSHATAGGLVMRAIHDTMVLSPPLVITKKEIDELVRRATAAVNATAKDLGVK
ncbi:MAG: aspartate aminotransferase family protein [Alphaproteobacteria bacterium]|nr:aspartate aminotransferase family protein [Alphaproteobacteria bacterium]